MKIRGYQGDLTLNEMQTQIRFEEAGSLELIDCVVATDKENQPINICKFKELPAGEIPKDIILLETASMPPPGKTKTHPTETMVIDGHFTSVDFYR